MPRSRRKTGDDATVARKRYYRSAERYLDKANETTGATSARYRSLARKELDNALGTYTKKTTQKFSKPIQKLANDLGVSLDEERQKIKARSDKQEQKIRSSKIGKRDEEGKLGGSSLSSLVSTQDDDEQRRQDEARAILNSPIGHRILGGFVDVWKDDATVEDDKGNEIVDNSKILPALFDYFDVDNLADMLEKVEEIIGDKLYADEDSDAMYEAVKIMLQIHANSDNEVTE